MPSSATLTTFYSFSPNTVIYSAEINNNFSAFRGHFLPVDPNTATAATTKTYDLGSDDHRWRKVWGKPYMSIDSTTGSMTLTGNHDYVLMDSTSATITASLPAVSGNTALSFEIKNIGTANSVFVDANSTELIDGTLTVNLVPGEAVKFVCTGSEWRMF